ncbi:MAG: SPOR domain-containing protein [Deltaproteobacteria bacterium]|jgi:hypothetical protein|nr:SPOR domain-containing protein [Deltaproteobacteria bacterium]
MLKTIFFGPGRVLCGRSVSENSRNPRFRLPFYRNPGQVTVLVISVFFWAMVITGGVLLTTLNSNVDPPAPPRPREAETEPPPASAPVPAERAGTGNNNLTASLTPAAVSASPQTAVSPPEATPLSPPEIWLVIVESIPKSARSEAEKAQARHKMRGVELDLLDTDAYPKLKSGMWTLAQGPFDSKKEAEAAALSLKPKVKDLMVRRGL